MLTQISRIKSECTHLKMKEKVKKKKSLCFDSKQNIYIYIKGNPKNKK